MASNLSAACMSEMMEMSEFDNTVYYADRKQAFHGHTVKVKIFVATIIRGLNFRGD